MSNQRNSLSVVIDSANEIERLLGEHKYDVVMLKSKQLIDYMARKLAEIYDVDASDPEIIDALFAEGILSKESLENYQRIRLIGISALQSDDTGAYNAKTSFKLLKHEVDRFSESVNRTNTDRESFPIDDTVKSETDTAVYHDENGGDMEERKPTKRYRENEGVELKNTAGIAAKIQRSRTKSKGKRTKNNLIRLALTFAPFIFILVVVGLVLIGVNSFKNRRQAPATTAATTESVSETESTLVEETTSTPTITRYVTTSALNVRSAPSTDGEKLTTLAAGTTVDFVGDYDNVWAIINYNGTQAYVSKQYLRLQE